MTAMAMNVAIRSALDVMLGRDEHVVVFGEDVGYFGGVFRCTEGLQAKYGAARVFDTPIAEGGIIGVAVGMGAYGLRPVPEIQFADYVYPGLDQLISEAARLRCVIFLRKFLHSQLFLIYVCFRLYVLMQLT